MTSKVSSKTIAFISNISQLRYLFSDQMVHLYKDVHFICLTPASEYYASKMGIKHSSVEDLYDPAELMRIGSEGYESCEKFAKYLDSEIDANFNDLCTKGYFSSALFVYHLKTFKDTILGKLHILHSVIEALSPSKVICFVDRKTFHHYGQDYYLGDMIFRLLELLKGRFDYELVSYEINISEEVTSRNFQLRKILGGIRWIQLILSRIKMYVYHKPFENPELGTIAIGQSNTLAVLNDYVSGWMDRGGKIVSIAKIITDSEFSPTDIDRSALLAKFGITVSVLENFWDMLNSKPEFIRWFEYRGINFSTVAAPWLQQFVCFTFPMCVLVGEVIEKKLKESGASVFLTPSVTHRNEVASVLACKRLDMIVCSVLHGGAGYFKAPIFEYTDYKNIDYALVSGQGVSNFVRQEYRIDSKEGIAEPVAVGNPILGRLYSKQRRRSRLSQGTKRRILYIPTHLVSDFFYYGWNCYPNIWYSRFQRRIVETLRHYPDVTLYVKQYPVLPIEDPLQKYVKDEGISNIVFPPKYVDMSRYIDMADMFIMDFPTTSLLKILCTRKPAIIYYKPEYLKMSLEAQKLLKNRVELCLTEDKFMTTIKKSCELSCWPELENPDDAFLIHYGICGNDIDPKSEVAKFLLSILPQSSKLSSDG